jgi:hypothetical protein
MSHLILNKAKAEAVYNAMCHLNNVGGSLSAIIQGVRVEETHSGAIQVWTFETIDHKEFHASQADFAIAYGLQ